MQRSPAPLVSQVDMATRLDEQLGTLQSVGQYAEHEGTSPKLVSGVKVTLARWKWISKNNLGICMIIRAKNLEIKLILIIRITTTTTKLIIIIIIIIVIIIIIIILVVKLIIV